MSTGNQQVGNSQLKVYKDEDWHRPQPIQVVKAMGTMMESSISNALPAFMKGQAKAILRAMYTEVTKMPKLLEATPSSLFAAVISAAQMGLQLGGALGQAYLIPFGRKVNLIIGYKGYIQLVNRSGQVGVMHAETVWEKDVFKVTKGSTPSIIHEPYQPQSIDEVFDTKTNTMKRKAVAFYATVMTKNGPVFETMSRIEAEIHRARFAMFKRNDAVWWTHFEAMAMKTTIIRLSKYLPMSAELQMALSAEATSEAPDAGFDPSAVFSSTTIQIAGEAEEDKTTQTADPVKLVKDDRPDEEREPENLPEANPGGTAKTAKKVKNSAAKGKGDGTMFGNGTEAPRGLPD